MHFFKWLTLFLFCTSLLQARSKDTADYVIVGVGNAGGLLAKRLTDDKKTSVIALHSGENFTDTFILKYSKNVPFSVLATLLGSPLPFDPDSLPLPPDVIAELKAFSALSSDAAKPLYETGVSVPQTFANNREVLWVISLPGGGGSSVNAGIWCRATNQLFQKWEALAGPFWSPSRLQAIYKNLEKYKGSTTNPAARGKHGPLKVLQDNPPSPLAQVFSFAMSRASNTSLVIDYNDPNTPIGASSQMQATHRGEDGFYRVSSMTAFLDDDVMKQNGQGKHGRKLQVLFNSMGLRTIWNGNTAVGVEYLKDGQIQRAFAKKGVIVCAGLRSSPFLLQSGIGDATFLTSKGITPVFDNPNVGQNLTDQPHVVILFSSNPNDSLATTGTNRFFSQICWLPAPGGDPISRQVRFSTIDIIPGLTVGVVDLVQPSSHGSVSISSANPLDPPVVDPGELSDPSDLDLFVNAFQIYIKNLSSELQAIDPTYQLLYPDPAILNDTVALKNFIRENIEPNMHFQGHCRMAPLTQGGVVDSTGRVYGVQNLFVADNSINPTCMDGSPMSSAYLVAENIAELLGY